MARPCPYRVWKNRLHGPQLGVWSNEYNDPVPGESFTYPEFKGYFAGVQWMKLKTKNGTITLQPGTDKEYVGVISRATDATNCSTHCPKQA